MGSLQSDKLFINLDNSSKTVVHYLLIREITYLGRRDGFPMISTPMYTIYTRCNLR